MRMKYRLVGRLRAAALGACVAFAVVPAAYAHKVNIFAYPAGDQVLVEG